MKIIWHNTAKNDLNNLIRYISKQSPKNAIMVLETITKIADSLQLFPLAYPKEPIYNKDDIRFISKWSYKIIFKIDKESIYILRIFNTKQHPNNIKST